MNIIDIINKKKINLPLNNKEIEYTINNYLNNTIKDYQMSALLMAIYINGMNKEEIDYLTECMIRSGDVIDLSSVKKTVVDKHSTGGVGDKTTLIIAPIVAACGVPVAKMSGSGLGYTGGTIDKLLSIPNFKVNMTTKQFIKQVKKINLAIVSQTDNLVPADKKIYALRDVTGTTESIPLIASSIMSKKIASGADNIVIDIKIGRGALIKTIEDGEYLADIMIDIAKRHNKKVECLLTNMDIPLGYNIGNTLEVEEAITVLNNKGEKRLTQLCIALATHMVSLGLEISLDEANMKVTNVLENKQALNKFYEFVKEQNGDIANMLTAKYQYEVKSNINGYITNIDALELAEYSCKIGSGRINKDDIIDYSTGITINKNINDYVKTGDIILVVHSNQKLTNYNELIDAITISSQKIQEPKLIYKIIK